MNVDKVGETLRNPSIQSPTRRRWPSVGRISDMRRGRQPFARVVPAWGTCLHGTPSPAPCMYIPLCPLRALSSLPTIQAIESQSESR